MLNVEKVFIVHYSKLTDRKARINQFLGREGINAEFVSTYDRENLTPEMIAQSYTGNAAAFDATIRKAYGGQCVPFRYINMAEISCTLNHYECIRRVSTNTQKYGLIFEDDMLGVDNFTERFNKYLSKTPDDWDAIFMGGCCGLRIAPNASEDGQIAFRKDHPASKCGDGYMLRTELAKKMADTMMPFNTISDWELSYQLWLHNATVYWWEPPILSQGSETGLFKSELR